LKASKQLGGFVLAGGKSSRMGTDKALLTVGGATLLARAVSLLEPLARAVVIVGPPRLQKETNVKVVPDAYPECGPLGGIATALAAAEQKWNLIIACDLPYLTDEWLQYLIQRATISDGEAVMAENKKGWEPLCAMYRHSLGAKISAALERGVRKVTVGLVDAKVEIVSRAEWKRFDPRGRLFKNVNAPEDYEEARALLGGG
jgi:molybdenum cofactor guanylyltransferase